MLSSVPGTSRDPGDMLVLIADADYKRTAISDYTGGAAKE